MRSTMESEREIITRIVFLYSPPIVKPLFDVLFVMGSTVFFLLLYNFSVLWVAAETFVILPDRKQDSKTVICDRADAKKNQLCEVLTVENADTKSGSCHYRRQRCNRHHIPAAINRNAHNAQ